MVVEKTRTVSLADRDGMCIKWVATLELYGQKSKALLIYQVWNPEEGFDY